MTFLPGSKVKITNFTEKEKSPNREKIYDYKISNRGGLSFIRMNFDKQLYGDYDTPLFFRNSANEHLFLYCEYFCKFIGKDNKVAHERALAWRLSEFSFGFFKWCETARATNEVVEGKTTYSVENLFSGKDFTGCFAMPNNGKGEKVVFDSSKDGMTQESPILGDGDVQVLILISGFINYERPHLYKDNSRPKKIKFAIHNPHNKTTITKVFDLKDTPQPQVLKFDRVLRGNIITMEILEVYPGEKYNDVCISKLWERLMRKSEFREPNRIPLEDL
ncbi:MAG TPA: hypothetical protein PK385_01335 [Spirochaetota bacterium]|nr:hypothetical protein [Spirochaetota bacterium]HOS32304.1 hypothetical protein [Spirochaetota bacterium]HOS54682.1 hypothetical protein [Spirochaetota bacterium]HPK60970.1 hypothetical protein [Spirochaetota bacterium]HQF77298.1 hypothetical protein [Spirochaetota bacterium]